MAAMIIHPVVSDYLDLVSHGGDMEFKLQEVELHEDSSGILGVHEADEAPVRASLAIAAALLGEPEVLIFDEPTNGLDIPSKVIFRKIMAGSIEEDQLVIISTHQVKDVENLIDNLVILKNGSVVFHETTEIITDNFIFTSTRSIDEKSTLYSEQVPGGYKAIARQTNGKTTEIDIELLFNAINLGTNLTEEVTHE